MEEKWYGSGYLIDALIEAGIVNGATAKIKGHQWITKAEKAGKIKPHKIHTFSGILRRRFREKDVVEIIEAFTVGGSGKWEASPI